MPDKIRFQWIFFMTIHLCLGLEISLGGGGVRGIILFDWRSSRPILVIFLCEYNKFELSRRTPDPTPDPRLPSIFTIHIYKYIKNLIFKLARSLKCTYALSYGQNESRIYVYTQK